LALIAADVENTFLELGRYLRQLLDRDPELFKKVVDKTALKRRKAYYLVEVSRIFDRFPCRGRGCARSDGPSSS
jgi:hypothetical protein